VTSRPAVIAPLTPEQYKLQITISRETLEKLRRVQDLLRHALPGGDPAVLFDRAMTALLSELERTKLARTDRPRQSPMLTLGSRHVPAAVRRAVWTRDGGRCAFVGANGRRCTARGFIEFHHTAPYAAGGAATVDSIELRCRAHNLYEGALDFGPAVRRHATSARASSAQ
jgi:5-methylcytosine-specific restriction endonuclease McrA